MRLVDFTLKLLGITQTMSRWQGIMASVDNRRRDRIARYAEEIAGTLARAGDAFDRLGRDPADRDANRIAVRELGRLGGYLESIVGTLEGRVDGRRLAGIKRRLETLAAGTTIAATISHADAGRIERLAASEGYFRALADSLRT